MKLASSIFISSVALATLNPNLCLGAKKNQKPNLVVIFTDDQGYRDLSCFDAQGFQTPNIDKLSQDGIKFTNFYAGASVCTPSRAALLTGCYPERVGMSDVLFPKGPTWTKNKTNKGLNPNETTLPEMLKAEGYATACVGKWHLGHLPEFLPVNHGFDEFFGLPYSHDMNPVNNPKFPALPLMEDLKVIEENPDLSQLTTRYTERAVDFINRSSDKPFFLYMAHSMPHVPLFVSDKFKGKSEKGLYGDVVMEIDWSVGQIVKALKEKGLYENTLLIFTSDNGPWLTYGEHAGSAGPLREGKTTTFEGGLRVPCIMTWPKKMPKGVVCNEMLTAMDIMPSMARLAKAKLPEAKIDGKDITNILKGKRKASSPHKSFLFINKGKLEAIRVGDWKLILPHQYNKTVKPGTMGRRGRNKRVETGLELYNLKTDIGEKNDLAAQHPDLVEKLKLMATEQMELLQKEKRDCGIVDDK